MDGRKDSETHDVRGNVTRTRLSFVEADGTWLSLSEPGGWKTCGRSSSSPVQAQQIPPSSHSRRQTSLICLICPTPDKKKNIRWFYGERINMGPHLASSQTQFKPEPMNTQTTSNSFFSLFVNHIPPPAPHLCTYKHSDFNVAWSCLPLQLPPQRTLSKMKRQR